MQNPPSWRQWKHSCPADVSAGEIQLTPGHTGNLLVAKQLRDLEAVLRFLVGR